MIFLYIIGLVILSGVVYFYYEARVENIANISRALVWKALSISLSNINDDGLEADVVLKAIDVFKKDMEILNKIGLFQLLFSDIPSLLSVEANKAINEYALAVNSIVKIK